MEALHQEIGFSHLVALEMQKRDCESEGPFHTNFQVTRFYELTEPLPRPVLYLAVKVRDGPPKKVTEKIIRKKNGCGDAHPYSQLYQSVI